MTSKNASDRGVIRGPHPDPRVPALRLPPLSCDAHCHLFGPGDVFPYAEDRAFTPPDVTKDDLRARHDFLGLQRAVIVQSASHGSDHAALVDALRTRPDNYRGVALLKPQTPPDEVARLHGAGVRGARLQFLPRLGTPPSPEGIRAVVDLVRPYSWHMAFHVAGDSIVRLSDVLRSIDLPVVIDHMARVDIRAGLQGDQVRALRRLLDTGNVWVKLSGAERLSISGPPYGDAIALAVTLAAQAPERVLWGTDFPHPNVEGEIPDDGLLVDLIAEIAPSEKARRLMLVDNPAALFEFPTTTAGPQPQGGPER